MYEKAPTDLRSHTKALLKPSATGIEIGGGFNPLITRKEGYIIHTIDHVSKEQLIEKYKDTVGLSPLLGNIEHVDGVDDGREFRDLLGLENGAEHIVSIHNFEHIPNPIRFLQPCANALSETGKLYLIIPDRRGTFDYFRPCSTIGQWMEAYCGESHHPFSGIIL